jgi:rSAM/selenodomain-associated transferase 1
MPPEAGKTLLVQFAKAPVPGEVKSRMIPHLTPDEAMALYCDLVRWTSRNLVNARLGPVQLAVAGDTSDALFDGCRLLGVAGVVQQSGEGLGERMYRALRAGLETYEAVVLVGSDCPGLDRAYLAEAVASLARVQVVLGPAFDGGYVLIGATKITPEIFRGIDWGSSSVFRQTTGRLAEAGIDWAALPKQRDVDRPEDLPHWEAMRGRGVPLFPLPGPA